MDGQNQLKLVKGGGVDPRQMEMFASGRPGPVEHPVPDYLGAESQEFWRDVCGQFYLEAHHLKILEAVCTCWDRIVTAREEIAENGVFVRDRYKQIKTSPAVKVETDNKVLLARLIRELQLDVDLGESRPPRLY